MADKFSPPARSLYSLRVAAEKTQKDLAAAGGLKDGSLLSQFENGSRTLTYDYLEELAAHLGVPPEGVEVLLLAHGMLWQGRQAAEADVEPGPLDPTPEERSAIWRTAVAASWSVLETSTATLLGRLRAKKVENMKRQAEQAWAWLAPVWRQDGRRHVLVDEDLRSTALAARICEASVRAAANNVEDALALARFALFVAEQVPEEARRARSVGFCRAFVANALRVAEKIDAAVAELAEAWEHWKKGDASEPEILPEWRLLSLEASLWRVKRQFAAANECLDRALAQCGGEPAVTCRILLQKANILDASGDTGGALAALISAVPFVEAAGEPRQLFGLRFKMVSINCGLERYKAAAEGLTGLRNMAIEQANALDLIRVTWLTAKVDAGQGREREAIAGLEQVCRGFWAHGLPIEVALASLDLAVLLLEASRTAEVKQLAITMDKIFAAQGFTAEALAALTLFCGAAKQELATVELTRWVITEVETARRMATPTQEQEWPRPDLG